MSVSVLVDLRPYIAPDAATSQAFGTVGVGCKVLPMVDGLRHHVLDLAATATAQLRTRISRGEAHRQAMALASGRFEEGAPPATLELSNHGVYRECSELALAQRFDGYDGISVAVHSEHPSGSMRLCASAGANIAAVGLERLMFRATELFGLVA